MRIEWTGRGVRLSERLRDHVDVQLAKLQRRLRGHTQAHVILTREGPADGARRQIAEIVLRNRLGTFTARSEAHDLWDAVNVVLDKLDRQVRRARERMVSSRRRAGG